MSTISPPFCHPKVMTSVVIGVRMLIFALEPATSRVVSTDMVRKSGGRRFRTPIRTDRPFPTQSYAMSPNWGASPHLESPATSGRFELFQPRRFRTPIRTGRPFPNQSYAIIGVRLPMLALQAGSLSCFYWKIRRVVSTER